MSIIDRISLAGQYESATRPALNGTPMAAASTAADGKHPPARPGRPVPDRRHSNSRGGHSSDWLERKLKGLYDEVANEPLPKSLQKLIDELDG